MTQRRWLLMVSLLALIAAACSSDTTSPSTTAAGDTGATTPTTTSGSDDPGTTAASVDDYCADGADGTLIWAHEQEPPDLHLNDPNNNLSVTSYVWQVMWDDLYGISAALDFYPELLAEEGVVNDNGDGTTTIDFRLRDGLTWSDGEALTADDVKFTFDILMEGYDPESGGGIYLIGSRTGYDLITDFRVNSDTEFSIDFSAFYAGWKTLFTNVFPAHAFGEGAGATEVNEALSTWTNADGEILPSSGPMVFESWEQGVSMNFVRNDNYHGSVSPDTQNKGAACVSALKINWVTDTDAQINSLKSGEAHIIFTQPQLAFEEIGNDPAFTVAASPGPIWEHWGFNVLGVHLSKSDVREALALALDKTQVVQTLYAPLFGDALAADGLGNSYWMANQPAYVNHQGDAGYGKGDVDGAKAKLEAAGYTLGDDGVYAHPEDGRLSLRVGTTGGNALRELQQQIIQAQMKAAGIEITIDNVPGSGYFTERPFNEANLLSSASGGELGDSTLIDIMQFAWVGGPWPGGQSPSYLSGGVVDGDDGPVSATNNPYGFRNEAFDARAAECDATIDDAQRADCYNELDLYATTLQLDAEQGLFVLPLTQKPDFFAYSNELLVAGAVSPDTNTAGPLSNMVDYKLR